LINLYNKLVVLKECLLGYNILNKIHPTTNLNAINKLKRSVMAKKKKKKKLTKKKKKFFIIVSCYIATFLITSLVTLSTLAWFNGSEWQDDSVYMGGPVYIYFSDNTETNITSGAGSLVSHLPATWERIYPGMNIVFEAKAVFQGHEFTNTDTTGEEFNQYTSTGVLRARIKIEVTDPRTNGPSAETQEIYDWIWPQFVEQAAENTGGEGIWVFDEINMNRQENNYFYYCVNNQTGITDHKNLILGEIGGKAYDEAVSFLDKAIIQFPGMELTNAHADCEITFTIVFEAVQAFFPYEMSEVGIELYQGDTTGRDIYVTIDDVGMGKPLTLGNSRKLFNEAQHSTFPDEVQTPSEPENPES
jgi:hypothetical protein